MALGAIDTVAVARQEGNAGEGNYQLMQLSMLPLMLPDS